jgi:tetratricopeptide (TPR) repeat protein
MEPEPSPEPSDAAAAVPLPEAEPVSETPVAEGREELEASTIETTHQSEALAAPQAVPPDEATLAAGPDLDSPLTEVERYRLHLEQMPKDHDTRLLLARAYSAQEQMRLSLEQYQRLLRSRRDVLSKAIQDVETIVASRPDLLDAHELLADFYAKSGQLQEAVDRYRWVLRRLDEDTE